MFYVINPTTHTVLCQEESRAKAGQWLEENPSEGALVVEPLVTHQGADPESFPALAAQQKARREYREIIWPFLEFLQLQQLHLCQLPAGEPLQEAEHELHQHYLLFREIDRSTARQQWLEYMQTGRQHGGRRVEKIAVDLDTGEESYKGQL